MGKRKTSNSSVRSTFRNAVLLLWILMLACNFAVAAPLLAAERQSGGKLVFGVENEPAGYDVLEARGLAVCDAIIGNAIMERLFDLGPDGNLVSVLGLSATPSEEAKVWTIALRKGVTFHDGTPFGADAVVRHWNRMLDPSNKYRGLSTISAIESVDKLDDYTVRFRLKHPWEPFPRILTGDRGLTQLIPSPKSVDEGKQLRMPAGTGPFMIKEWKSGDRLVVVKNPNYWQKEKPLLDAIVFRIMPDHQTRFASLKSGQTDMIWMDRGNLVDRAKKDPSLAVRASDGSGAEIIVLNTKKPPLDNPKVRQAIAHAWNQKACVEMSYRGAIPVVYHPMDPSAGCGEAGYRKHDVETAEKLLAEYGKKVSVECLHTNTQRGKEQGEILQQFCKRAGIDVKTTGLSFGPIIRKVYTGDYDLSTWRIPSRTDQGVNFTVMFHSKSRGNVTGYSNPKMDELLERQQVETDPGKRRAILCEIAELINHDVPVIYRGGKRYYTISSPEVKGVGEIENGIVRFAEVWIDK